MNDLEKELEKFPLEEYKKEMSTLRNLIGIAVKEPLCIKPKKLPETKDDILKKLKEKGGYSDNSPIANLIETLGQIKNSVSILEKEIEFLLEEKNRKKTANETSAKKKSDEILEQFDKIKKITEKHSYTNIGKTLADIKSFGVYELEGNLFSLNVNEKIQIKTKNEVSYEWGVKAYKGTLKEIRIPVTSEKDMINDLVGYFMDEFIYHIKRMISDNYFLMVGDNPIKRSNYEDTLSYQRKIVRQINKCRIELNTFKENNNPTFILGSDKNIKNIMDSMNNSWKNYEKVSVYTDIQEYKYSFIINNDLVDTVIVGRCPLEGESGINLILNKNTFNNFEYSEDDDVCAVNIAYQFFAGGKNPNLNYVSFELTD